MKVNYIKTQGFRKFKDIFETDLYDITNITGENRSGKTNVLYAIINTMLGTNLSGDEKSSLINRKCEASYGEIHFTDNKGIRHILVRGKDKYDNNKNFLSLDGKIVTQKDLVKFYKDKKLFLSILNPMYFLTKKPAEQKELVDKCLNEVCPSDLMDKVYEKLDKKEQNILEGVPKNIPNYIVELNSAIKSTESMINTIDGKIEYAQNIANQELQAKKKFDKETELTLARQELAFLTTNKDIEYKEKQEKVVKELAEDIFSKETEFNELEKQMRIGKGKYLKIKDGTSCTCPVCEQKIQDESKNKTIINMKNELVALFDKRNLLETQIKDLKIKLSMEKCKYHALDGDNTVEKEKRINIVEENIKQLETEKLEIQKWNNEIELKETNINNAKNDIQKLNDDRITFSKNIDSLNNAKKIAQKLYISYIEEKMKLAKQYLKDVDIKFYSVLKSTGEIKEDFIITYKNNNLADLSRSETIATALEFANMFNKISKVNFPIFIDDYESCTDYDFINEYSKDTQLIISKAQKGNSLKIADYNSEKCTIIRPKISKSKTIKVNKNVAKISNAA